VPPIERLVFFGTPEFAVPSLDALVEAGRRPILVVSQPARPAGRRRRLVEPPVAERARELGIEVVQPARVRAPEFVADLGKLSPDLGIVVAFGQIFPPELLATPRFGCLNVHASLLPRWRGAAPIQAAIAAGDAETGVAVQQMEAGLDTGPVFGERRVPIGATTTSPELAETLSRLGAGLLVETVARIEAGDAVAEPQDEALSSYAPKLTAGVMLDLEAPADELDRRVRAYAAEPGVTLPTPREPLKVLRVRPAEAPEGAEPGVILALGRCGLTVGAGAGTALELLEVQRPGGRPVDGRALANGWRLAVGDRLT